MAPRTEVTISDGFRDMGLRLATDQQGCPLFTSETLSLERLIRPAAQLGEATYANFLPGVGGVYAQESLAGGAGKKLAVRSSDTENDRYYYAKRLDASSGAIQKGPKVDALAAPANATAPTGGFILAGVPYVCLGRIIASYVGGALTQVGDLGASTSASQPTTFIKLGTETAGETNTTESTSDTIQSTDARIAQQFRSSVATVTYLGRVDAKLIGATNTAAGDLRLQLYTDLNGKPGESITSARLLYKDLAGGTVVASFRFDDDDTAALPPGEPMWLVLDMASADTTNYVSWRRDAVGTYTRGSYATSSDGGNSWTTSAAKSAYFTVYHKVATSTVFVGDSTGTVNYQTTPDGSVYTADSYGKFTASALIGDLLLRDIYGSGALRWSEDGANWSEPLVLGDPTATVLQIVRMGGEAIVVKTDGIWAVDPASVPPSVEQMLSTIVSTRGSAEFLGAVYVPTTTHGIVGISGDFSAGHTVARNLGIEASPEWDNPLNLTRAVALAGDRFHLYAFYATSTAGTYELFKSAVPTTKRWHGSIATITTAGPTGGTAVVLDLGTRGPDLFFVGASGFVSHITLSQAANPANDTGYSYDTSTTGTLDLPLATGNLQVNPKAWMNDSMTFLRRAAGDYVELLIDPQDGDGYRRLPDPGRLFETGTLDYAEGTQARLMGRQVRLSNSQSTTCPVVLPPGVSFAARGIHDTREITFTVRAETGMSAQGLGDVLGLTAASQSDALADASVHGGTRKLIGPGGEVFRRVLFRSAKDITLTLTDRDHVQAIEVLAVGDYEGRATV